MKVSDRATGESVSSDFMLIGNTNPCFFPFASSSSSRLIFCGSSKSFFEIEVKVIMDMVTIIIV